MGHFAGWEDSRKVNAMTDADKLKLLDWITRQSRLRIEKWHHMGRKTSVSVWTQLDDDDAPSGRAATASKALELAMQKDLKINQSWS